MIRLVDRPTAGPTRVDLHLHSRASTDSGNWFLRKAVLPESFTEPEAAYRAAKSRGMDFVTLTDHNTVSGALEIAHHPDVFVSVEITTQFPEDHVPFHVLVWHLSPAQWTELDRVRDNAYELVESIAQMRLAHALAHPLQRLGAELTSDHIERFLLMFPVWEGLNGSRTRASNDAARRIGASISPEYLEKLAEKHQMTPRGSGPPSFTAGSDDHALLGVAGAWTETPSVGDPDALAAMIRAGRTTPCGSDGGIAHLAHAMVSLGVTSHARGGGALLPGPLRGLIGDILGQPLPAASADEPGPVSDVGAEMMRRIRGDRAMLRGYRTIRSRPDSAERAHDLVRHVTGWAHAQLLGMAAGAGRGSALTGLSERLGLLLGAGALAGPYLGSAAYHGSEARFARQMASEFFATPLTDPAPPRVAMFTDSYDELNGVAGTMRRLVAHARGTSLARVSVFTCRADESDGPLVCVPPVAHVPVPAYRDGDWRLGVPSILDVLQAVDERRIEVIHAATPGPMGLAGLLVAKVLDIPFAATHHTELAHYAMALTGDRLALEIVDLAMGWFYSQADRVYVPSRAAADTVSLYGVAPERIVRFERGIDTERFSPTSVGVLARRRIGSDSKSVVLLYVGRVSREKGVFALADAFRRVSADRPQLKLTIVGDGPDRDELAARLQGTRHSFTGPLRGRALAGAYAAADIFCLPSQTETFGQVVLEAMASGLPVIVSDRGAARELVRDGVTGIIARTGRDGDLAPSIARLADDEELRAKLGLAARAEALRRPTWSAIFDELLADYREIRLPEAPRSPRAPARNVA